MRNLQIDARQLDNLDIQGLGKKLNFNLSYKPAQGYLSSVVKRVAAQNSSTKQAVKVAEEKPNVEIIPPKAIGVGLQSKSSKVFTFAGGFSGGYAVIGGFTFGSGVYGSNTGEIGLYTCPGTQLQTNVGISGGIEGTWIWGPPSDFFGWAVAIGVDLSPFPPFGIGGRLIFHYQTLRWLGVSFAGTVGWSALPANLTIEVSETGQWVKIR